MTFFLLFSLFCFFLCVSQANVRQNVAKRKHISLYHSNPPFTAHQLTSLTWVREKKAYKRYWIYAKTSSYFLFKLSHIDFHISARRRLPFFMVNSDDSMIPRAAYWSHRFIFLGREKKVAYNKELWKSCFRFRRHPQLIEEIFLHTCRDCLWEGKSSRREMEIRFF